MRFDTLGFVVLFLPAVLLLFHLLRQWQHRAALTFLVCASLFFYGWWDVRYVALILISIAVNFGLGRALLQSRAANETLCRNLMVLGVVFNLGLIAYFKYADFFIDTANGFFDTGWTSLYVVLPLAISFFTFQQIAFLADVRAGKVARFDLLEYALFVLFFPQLIAGPIVHFREVVPQFRALSARISKGIHRVAVDLAVGVGIFAVGLFKKVVFADTMGGYVDVAFGAAAGGATLTFFEAWAATLCFTFQIYFDFSGYSDMAIGLARMFGVRLPLNFDSPYKATNIVEFWHRWHMTLSRFLRDYLYIPLGGNRRSPARRYVNLMITMLLGGLWHGAAWTFVVWGGIHGLYLIVCHLWQRIKKGLGLSDLPANAATRFCAQFVTFLCVAVAWSLFRAEDFETAYGLLRSMSGVEGVSLPADLRGGFGPLAERLEMVGLAFAPSPYWMGADQWLWIVILLFVVWYCPSTQEIFGRFRPALHFVQSRAATARATIAQSGAGFWFMVMSRGVLLILAVALALASIPPATSEGQGLAVRLVVLVAACYLVSAWRFEPQLSWRPTVFHTAIWSFIIMINLFCLYRGTGGEFIYFQF